MRPRTSPYREVGHLQQEPSGSFFSSLHTASTAAQLPATAAMPSRCPPINGSTNGVTSASSTQ